MIGTRRITWLMFTIWIIMLLLDAWGSTLWLPVSRGEPSAYCYDGVILMYDIKHLARRSGV